MKIQKTKYLILRERSNHYFLSHVKDNNKYSIYKKMKVENFLKFLDFNRKSKINIFPIILNNWKYKVRKTDVVIILDNFYVPEVGEYIKSKNKNCKVYLYFWNILDEEKLSLLNDPNIDAFFSFDYGDSVKYNLNYFSQFYSKNITLRNSKIEYDVLFLGRNKNRREELNRLEKELNNSNLKTKFIVIDKDKDMISYDEYLNLISKSKCILDYTVPFQQGYTIRCMESIFLNKKLISNNEFLKKSEFYKESNIFILQEDNINKIIGFLNKPYQNLSKTLLKRYDYNNWINQFVTFYEREDGK